MQINSRTLYVSLSLAIVLSALSEHYLTPALAADYIANSEIKVARHDKRRTRFTFHRGESSQPRFLAGLMFERYYWEERDDIEKRFISYEELDTCTKPEVRRDRVFQVTPGTDEFDVVYFNPNDERQLTSARKYKGRVIPYEPALLRDKKTDVADQWQVFARFIQVKCLPTRFHFTYVGQERYMEFRMGEEAWK